MIRTLFIKTKLLSKNPWDDILMINCCLQCNFALLIIFNENFETPYFTDFKTALKTYKNGQSFINKLQSWYIIVLIYEIINSLFNYLPKITAISDKMPLASCRSSNFRDFNCEATLTINVETW